MTQRVYLHVGAPKAGTTYLQRILDGNRDVLGAAGVLVVGERHLDRVHAAMAVREDPRLADLPQAAGEAWKRLVAQIRDWGGPAAVLSYELFAGASAEQVSAAVADLDGMDVHVVITARDLGAAVPSAWQERLKFALTTPLEQWRPRPESAGPRAEWGWRTMDPAGVAARWGAGLPADHVHVVTVPRGAAGSDELWHRFATACGIDADTVTIPADRANESLGVAAAELLRRVNAVLGDRLVGNREHALWLRDTLAHEVLSPLDREPIGLTDAQLAEAATRADEAVAAVAAAGYAVHGDLEDLRATRREARTPAEVDEAELLEVATEAIARLLLLVRDRSSGHGEPRRAPAPVTGPGGGVAARAPQALRGAARRLVRRASAPVAARAESRLEDRVARLEADLQDRRRLQLRVAEATDLVTELLLPAEARDDAVFEEALERYRRESL